MRPTCRMTGDRNNAAYTCSRSLRLNILTRPEGQPMAIDLPAIAILGLISYSFSSKLSSEPNETTIFLLALPVFQFWSSFYYQTN